MERERRITRKYDVEYIGQAVDMVIRQHLSISHVSKELGIPPSTLKGWVHRVEEKKGIYGNGLNIPITESPEHEFSRLRKENKELKMEVEILKKATAFFAKRSV